MWKCQLHSKIAVIPIPGVPLSLALFPELFHEHRMPHHRRQRSPEEIRYGQINKVLCLVAPLLISFLGVFYTTSGNRGGYLDDKAWGVIWNSTLSAYIPLFIGFCISLKWKWMHPIAYFFIGIGISVTVVVAFYALLFATCMVIAGSV